MNNERWHIANHSIYHSVKRETFTIGSTCLIVEDREHLIYPERSERILRLAGTGVYYSVVPLSPNRHRLLCYQYCAEAMEGRAHDYWRHALVMGCGGGAVPRWLLEEYPRITVDVVDISAKMIEVCRTYFLDRWDDCPRLQYHCIDAQAYVPPSVPYQFIFCDLFGGTELAPFVYEPAFAARLRGMLADDGILVINCGWGHMIDILQVYRAVFADVHALDRPAWQTEVAVAFGRLDS